jgi:ComF family protein
MTVGPHTDVSNGCASCRNQSLGFDAALRLGPYDGRLSDAVLRMKHAPGEPVAESFGRLFAERHGAAMKAAGIDLVVPVPLHWLRRWSRGYNQAEAIGREIAAAAELEFSPGCLRRVKSASQHAQPSATARRENIRGAFRHRPRASVSSRTVLLVDDVMTTGGTAGEAARILKEAGAEKVIAAVLARR